MNFHSFKLSSVPPAQSHCKKSEICSHLLLLPLGPSVPREDRGENKEDEDEDRPEEPVNQGELPVKEYEATLSDEQLVCLSKI